MSPAARNLGGPSGEAQFTLLIRNRIHECAPDDSIETITVGALRKAADDMAQLYEALEAARDAVHAHYCDGDHEPDAKERTDFDCERFGPIHCEECREATAALRKARGETLAEQEGR